MFRPVRVSRTTSACTLTFAPVSVKPATCGLPESSVFCASFKFWSGTAANNWFARSPVMPSARMPDPAIAVSNVIGISSPAFGELGPATTSIAFAPC